MNSSLFYMNLLHSLQKFCKKSSFFHVILLFYKFTVLYLRNFHGYILVLVGFLFLFFFLSFFFFLLNPVCFFLPQFLHEFFPFFFFPHNFITNESFFLQIHHQFFSWLFFSTNSSLSSCIHRFTRSSHKPINFSHKFIVCCNAYLSLLCREPGWEFTAQQAAPHLAGREQPPRGAAAAGPLLPALLHQNLRGAAPVSPPAPGLAHPPSYRTPRVVLFHRKKEFYRVCTPWASPGLRRSRRMLCPSRWHVRESWPRRKGWTSPGALPPCGAGAQSPDFCC